MPDRMIQCPECEGRGDPGCVTCHQYGFDINTGTIPDRRKPTANDRAVERIKAWAQPTTKEWVTRYDYELEQTKADLLRIIREEAERE